jgi:FkbM family methyltransferase
MPLRSSLDYWDGPSKGWVHDIKPALRGWGALQRARLAHRRHPELGEISAYCFYARKLRFGQLAFDIGANHGEHTARMVSRGARVVALEPQARLAVELAAQFPTAVVLQLAVSDAPGQAVLHLAREADTLASLDFGWAEACPCTWEGSEEVEVTTLDRLIDRYGEPAVVKIDTEGLDHRVLRGLSRPIEHVLFEVHSSRRHDAEAAFARLDELGGYDYYVAPLFSWLFRQRLHPEEIVSAIDAYTPAGVGDVYAQRVR